MRVWWEAYGTGGPAILLLPTWSIVHSRLWKAQIPYLARHFRVVTFDGRGNGFSDSPEERRAYADPEPLADAVAVLDAAGVDAVVAVGMSCGGRCALRSPPRTRSACAAWWRSRRRCRSDAQHPDREQYDFDDGLEADEGWAKENRHYWLADYRGFLEFFFAQMYTEPHSSKQIEDGVAWGLDTDAGDAAHDCVRLASPIERRPRRCAGRCGARLLVVHGDQDQITPCTGARASPS